MGAVLIAFVIVAPMLIYQAVYADRVHLGVTSMGVDLGGYSASEAKSALNSQFAVYAQGDLVLRYGTKEWRTTPGALGMRFESDTTVQQALDVGRSGNLLEQAVARLGSLRVGTSINPVISFDTERQTAVIANLAREIDRPMINASIMPRPDGTVELTMSQVGRRMDGAATLQRIRNALGLSGPSVVDLVVEENQPRVHEDKLMAAKETAERILRGPLTIVHGPESMILDQTRLTSLLSFHQEGDTTVAVLDEAGLATIVVEMAKGIDKEPRDAKFRYVNGRVRELVASIDGETVDVPDSVRAIVDGSMGETRIVPLVVDVTPPKVHSSDIAQIVVSDKLVEAATVYGDTGLDRQHNVKLAVSRLDGVLIPPRGTFSFNQELGPTGIADGYKYGWGIISTGAGHETVRSEAGGICQVATTVFHAAIWAGLHIDQRTEHLYWIPRYGKPPLGRTGLDATVDGSGSPDTLDFKFTNNTPNWIAIEGRYDAKDIFFALYGVKTGWTVELGEPMVTNVVKADPTQVRVEDKEVAPGQEVWVELAQDGFDVSIRRVVRDGSKIIDDYVAKSNYRPARNVIHVGPATPTPTATPTAQGGQAPSATPTAEGGQAPAATPTPEASQEPGAQPGPEPTATP